MPRKKTIELAPTAGFYKKVGDRLQYARDGIHLPGGEVLWFTKNAEYSYPVDGWTFYPSAEKAYSSEKVPVPAPNSLPLIANLNVETKGTFDLLSAIEQYNPKLAYKIREGKRQKYNRPTNGIK